MGYEVQEPVTVEVDGRGGTSETKTTHPSFAQVYAGRRSGRANLYGSDFSHNNYVVLSISGSELHRNLSNDWHFERGPKVEIAMSEAQWATLVSSLNVGGGVPCTLQSFDGEVIPRLPDPANRADQFGAEMKEDFDEAIAALDALADEIMDVKVSNKKREAILARVRTAKAKLNSSAPFVAEQFGEHMEEVTEKAKVEIHGYAQSLFQRAGVAALASAEGPLQLEDNSEES